MNPRASFAVLSVLLLAAAASAEPLKDAYRGAQEAAVHARAAMSAVAAAPAPAPRSAEPVFKALESFVPAYCSVESWCLVKATDCFVGQVTQPTGLWQAHAQYSVVRRAVALCRGRYGETTRETFMSPVEPVPFASAIQTTKKAAVDEAARLCAAYRKDWVSAAPTCPAP
jgi:hypothetical protein